MSLSIKEVDYIAKLAKLGLSEAEKKKYSKELSKILDYFEKLKQADTKGVQLVSLPADLKNIFREDEKPHEIDAEKIKKMIGQSPEREDNFVKTKPILEK